MILESQLRGGYPSADWHTPRGGCIEIASEQAPSTDGRSTPTTEADRMSRTAECAVFARTGFFVLYSVFKERSVERARWPELDCLVRYTPVGVTMLLARTR